ncbi:hypothetical protein [Aeromonas phage 3]|nr:hypothetical protein [Aeromonas phage 3]
MSKQLTYIYTTKVGEMLDEIVFAHYERHDQLKMVLEANPGIARHGAVLPQGLEVTLPPEPLTEKQYISLWS